MCREDEQDKLPNLLGRYTYLKDSITHPSLWPSHSSYLFQFLHQPRALCLSCLPDFYGAYGICKLFNQLSRTSLISFFNTVLALAWQWDCFYPHASRISELLCHYPLQWLPPSESMKSFRECTPYLLLPLSIPRFLCILWERSVKMPSVVLTIRVEVADR